MQFSVEIDLQNAYRATRVAANRPGALELDSRICKLPSSFLTVLITEDV
jgi:hypothetical protein